MTLRANELRIGNIVTIDNKDSWPEMRDVPVIVIAIGGHMDADDKELFPESTGQIHVLYDKDSYSQFDQFIKPIPLTEEWLMRFGFEKQPNGIWYLLKWHKETAGSLGILLINGAIQIGSDLETQRLKGIKYVHQLQNLYFALTGEELPIANHPV